MTSSLLIPLTFSLRSLLKGTGAALVSIPSFFFGPRLDLFPDAMLPRASPSRRDTRRVDHEPGIGGVREEALFVTAAPGGTVASGVTLGPGAVTDWHSHPHGETLVVTGGVCLLQRWGGPVEELRRGDTAWIAPGERHWHGAAAFTSATHVSLVDRWENKGMNPTSMKTL